MTQVTISGIQQWTQHTQLIEWIEKQKQLCQPNQVHLCDGSEEENQRLLDLMVSEGMCLRLNESKRPNSYLFRSDPRDVARVESRTFICSQREEDAGPTNHWRNPEEMRQTLNPLFQGCMQGRTMYVIPFCMGPLGSPMSIVGVEITDSPYVVCNMRMMSRMGKKALNMLGSSGSFIPCIHSVGMPLQPGTSSVPWPCNADEKYIVHFPETQEIWSYGSGYGGNALLGKKCLALRIASTMAKKGGWLAEHMAIVGITNPEGKKKYFAAAFPSACGKTNFAMLTPSMPGWKVECVGDDIAWMHFDENGQLYAINPEAGFFGVAPGTSMDSNPNAMKALTHNTFFTNVAQTQDNDVWWEGFDGPVPQQLTDWKNRPWTPQTGEKASHPNARFTVSAAQCPVISAQWEEPKGVPISGIIFGGRRSNTIPLVYEARNWQHGSFLGASVSSERTAAAEGKQGELRHDPFAMLPFCGYHMGNYFHHWLEVGQSRPQEKLPKIFYVNWFKRDEQGQFLWPGFGENIRVLEWMFNRTEGKGEATDSAIGYLPNTQTLNLNGLSLSPQIVEQLFAIDKTEWLQEVNELKTYFQTFGTQLPQGIRDELTSLEQRLS